MLEKRYLRKLRIAFKFRTDNAGAMKLITFLGVKDVMTSWKNLETDDVKKNGLAFFLI